MSLVSHPWDSCFVLLPFLFFETKLSHHSGKLFVTLLARSKWFYQLANPRRLGNCDCCNPPRDSHDHLVSTPSKQCSRLALPRYCSRRVSWFDFVTSWFWKCRWLLFSGMTCALEWTPQFCFLANQHVSHFVFHRFFPLAIASRCETFISLDPTHAEKEFERKSRARSPGREEVDRMFGRERRRSRIIEAFEVPQVTTL